MSAPGVDGIPFLKGHGTQNDFVVLPDLDARLVLTAARVRALCDRPRGLGADGVLRVVRNAAMPDVEVSEPDGWFMDYRNADGSIAEMCGNGVRVFARYLLDAGLIPPGQTRIGTRNGARAVNVGEGGITVDMGPARQFGASTVTLGGATYDGIAVDLGNPHLACVTTVDVDKLDLTVSPRYDHQLFDNGVNTEFVNLDGPQRVRMRVYERGVGETRSCGTGTVAATVAALHASGERHGRRTVCVPGGEVDVEVTEASTFLTGPAELVARGVIDSQWWRDADHENG